MNAHKVVTPPDVSDDELCPIMIRVNAATREKIDHKIQVEKSHTARAGVVRTALMQYLDQADPKDIRDQILKELENGAFDEALKGRIRHIISTGMQ